MKILFVSIDFPYPPLKADSIFVYHMLKQKKSSEQAVSISMGQNYHPENVDRIENLLTGLTVVDGLKKLDMWQKIVSLWLKKPLSLYKYDFSKLERAIRQACADQKPDRMVFADPNLIELGFRLRDLNIPNVFHTIDSVANNLKIRSRHERNFLKKCYQKSQARKWQRVYRRFLPHYNAIITVTKEEKSDFKRFLPEQVVAKIQVLRFGVDTDFFRPVNTGTQKEPSSLIFHGNMNDSSEKALQYFCDIYDEISAQVPEVKLYLVGRNPTRGIKRMAASRKHVVKTGFVKDIRDYLNRASIGVYPMVTGSGIKDRVLEAMSMGLPVVTTRRGLVGIEAEHGVDVLVADTATDFKKLVLNLIDDEQLRTRIGSNARRLVQQKYNTAEVHRGFEKILNSIDDQNDE